jgi:hypothetical protein
MGCPNWKLVSRGLFASGLALLNHTSWRACAGPSVTASEGLVQNHIPTAPAFEAEAAPGSAGRFVWRNRNIAAELDSQGGISFRFQDGQELAIAFIGAKAGVEPQGESAPYPVSYFLGSSRSWHSSIRWEHVRYPEIYPGIDLVFATNAGQLEYTFVVHPKADPRKIRIRYCGAAVRLNEEGDLVIRMGAHRIDQRRPSTFQSDGLLNRTLQCSYDLKESEVTLRLEHYDLRHPLTIDPILNFSAYLGGASYDAIYALASDPSGNIYVAGETASGSIPGNTQPPRSSRDVWVAKLNSSGTQLLYLIFLGGSGNDSGRGIAVDSSGNAYVTGITASTDFPTTAGAFSTQTSGSQEAFVAKLNAAGQLQYSTYLGGGSDAGFAIAVDATGAAYVAGQTMSVTFPVTAGAIQPSNQGGISDCFVSKLSVAGSSLVYSTYLGGTGLDLCTGIAIDAANDAYITGTTYSTNFPTQAALQNTLFGSASAFVSEINPAGTALLYSTYLGGSVLDNGNAIAVDSSGSAYVTGTTSSFDFPTTAGAVQTVLGGLYNAFVSKLAPGGSSLTYSTFIGGSGVDTAAGIAVDSSGQAILGGYTSSLNFPVAGAIQATFRASSMALQPW